MHLRPPGACIAAVSSHSNGTLDVSSPVREQESEARMPSGTIKKLVADRGFGFIAADDGTEYFFHRSGTETDFDSLRGGEQVDFEIEASAKGPRAGNVRLS